MDIGSFKIQLYNPRTVINIKCCHVFRGFNHQPYHGHSDKTHTLLSFLNWIFTVHCKVVFPALSNCKFDWYKQHGRLLCVWLLEGFVPMKMMLCPVSKLRDLSNWQKLHFKQIVSYTIFYAFTLTLAIVQGLEYFHAMKCPEKLCVFVFLCEGKILCYCQLVPA